MYMCTKCDQNIPCGSRVMSIFTNLPRMDGQMDGGTDSHNDYSADPSVMQYAINYLTDYSISSFSEI